jgi:Undecaprenyl-phosphate galactose phosphotransferase WbaP
LAIHGGSYTNHLASRHEVKGMKPEIFFQDPSFFSNNTFAASVKYRRRIMSAFLVFSDTISITLSLLFVEIIIIWRQGRVDLDLNAHSPILLTVVMFLLLNYRLMKLYPGVGIGPIEELKRLTKGTSIVAVVMIMLNFSFRSTTIFPQGIMLISWILILIGVPTSRKLFRRLAHKLGFWGIPVVLIGKEKKVMSIQQRLNQHPLSGFWPVLCIDGQSKDIFQMAKEYAPLFAQLTTLIIAIDHGNFDSIHYLITQKAYPFKQTILLFDEAKSGPIWFTSINIVEHIGFEVASNLLNLGQQFIKRILEIGLIILSLPLLLILSIFIAIAIKLNSPGPILFKHKRVGVHGKDLWVWKFRTMQHNANNLLAEYLEGKPMIQKEWKDNVKLKVDPRVTSFGRLLRQTSLDEVPQILNVIKGEMNLVGPRPITQNEIPLYGKYFEIYKQVTPGITGLWQISGRNNLPYQERVSLDVYYIQNWSIWMDIHILMHTLLAVIQRRGAY